MDPSILSQVFKNELNKLIDIAKLSPYDIHKVLDECSKLIEKGYMSDAERYLKILVQNANARRTGTYTPSVRMGAAQRLPYRDRFINATIDGKSLTIEFAEMPITKGEPIVYGYTDKITDQKFNVCINIDSSIRNHRIFIAIIHELLHVVNFEAAKDDNLRHASCHYLACALSAYKDKKYLITPTDLKLHKFATLLRSIRTLAVSTYNKAIKIRKELKNK